MRNFQKLKIAELEEQAEILKDFILWLHEKQIKKATEQEFIHLSKVFLNMKGKNNND